MSANLAESIPCLHEDEMDVDSDSSHPNPGEESRSGVSVMAYQTTLQARAAERQAQSRHALEEFQQTSKLHPPSLI